MGLALIEPDEVIGDSFEARVCPLALAAVTGVFDHDPAVISVVEEAQFRGRPISIHHCASTAEITMRVALTSDCVIAPDLLYCNAYELLKALGMATDSDGEIPLEQVRNLSPHPEPPAPAATRRTPHFHPRTQTPSVSPNSFC